MPFYSPYLQFQQEHIKSKRSLPHPVLLIGTCVNGWAFANSSALRGLEPLEPRRKELLAWVGNNNNNNNNPLFVPAQDFCFLIHQCTNKLC